MIEDKRWPYKICSAQFETTLTPEEEKLIKARMNDGYRAMRESMITSMFQENATLKWMLKGIVPISRWARFKTYFWIRKERIKDAWLVLRGKADIY